MRFISVKVVALLLAMGLLTASAAAETMTLDDCIELALKRRANIIIARGREKQAGANQLAALGRLLPNVRGNYTYTKSHDYDIVPGRAAAYRDTIFTTIIGSDTAKDAGSVPTSYRDKQDIGPNKSLSLDASLDLINFSNWFSYSGSKGRHSSQHLASINSEQELIFDVKSAYYGYLRAVKSEEVNVQAVERSKEQLKLVESRYELGSAAYSDVLGQRVQYGNDRLELLRAQNTVTTSRAFLAYTIGLDPNREVDFATLDDVREYEGSLDDAVNFGIEHEPGLLSAKAEMNAGNNDVKAALANYIPNLSLFARYTDFSGQQAFPVAFDYSNKSTTIGFQISYNIFDGFGRERQVSSARITHNNSQATFSDTRNGVVQEIKTAYLNIQNQKEAVAVADETVKAAEEDIKIVQERYNLGAATILDLLQAQEDLKRAQVSFINSKFDLNLAISRLENAMGKP